MRFPEAIKDIVRSVCSWHKQGAQPNIALFATPRGGSTWVMEILAAQPGMKFVDEPLNIRRENVQRTGVFAGWDELMPEGHCEDRIIDFLAALAMGRYGNMNTAPFQKNYRILTNRVVYKIHAAKHLANQVRDRCGCQIVYLLRHPIPNTLSRTVFPRLEHFLESPFYMDGYLTPDVAKEVRKIANKGNHLQRGIVSWCFENIDAHRNEDKEDWTILTYEELIQNPSGVCSVLADNLGLADLERTLGGVSEAATNVAMSDRKTQEVLQRGQGDGRTRYLISRWRDKVSDAEERELFSIIDLFEVDFYRVGRDIASEKYLLCEPSSV